MPWFPLPPGVVFYLARICGRRRWIYCTRHRSRWVPDGFPMGSRWVPDGFPVGAQKSTREFYAPLNIPPLDARLYRLREIVTWAGDPPFLDL